MTTSGSAGGTGTHTPSAAVGAEVPAIFCPPNRRIYVLVAAILASSMAFIDSSVLSIATPAIRADLGASLSEAQWISNAYLLFLASLLLIGGAVGDRFGLRKVFAAGIMLFVLASLVCALAPIPMLLILARAVQGVGAAFMVPGSLAIIAKAYPREQRGGAIGIWAMASSLTTMLGPVLGGLLLTSLGDWSWRLVFAINLPLGAAALLLLAFLVPADTAGHSRRLDLVGGALVTAGLLLLALGLTAPAGESLPKLSDIVLMGGGGLLVLALFLLWESRTRDPMLPLPLFGNASFSGANGLTLALYAALAGFGFFLPMALIAGWGTSPAEVALAMLPLGLALTLLSVLSGRLADRYGAGPPIALGSFLVALAFAGIALTMPLHNLFFVLTPLVALLGIGMGLLVSPLSTAVMTSVTDAETGIASGVNNAVARVAGLLGIAIMGGLVALVFQSWLGLEASSAIAFGMPVTAPIEPALEATRVTASDAAFSALAWTCCGLALVSAVIAWTTLEKRWPARTRAAA